MRLHNIKLLAIILSTLLVHFIAWSGQVDHSKWMKMPTKKLLEHAQASMDNGSLKDTALMCYTIVGNRYDKSMTREQKIECVNAYMKMWSIYYYRFYDFPKCFDCLTRAHEIAQEAQYKDANIYIGFGCMYQTISEECNNYELGTKALEYYKKALAVGIETRDYLHTDMASTDVISMSHARQGLNTMGKEWQSYTSLQEKKAQGVLRQYNLMLYNAFSLIENKKIDDAINIFDHQLALIDTTRYSRLISFTLVEKAKALALKGDYRQAIKALQRPEQIALEMNMKDYQLEVFGMLAQYYQAIGDQPSRQLYRDKFTALKDTLNNYHQLASVSEMEFQHELKDMQQEMTEVKTHREIMSVVTLVSLAFLAVVLLLLFFVFKKNRQLKRSNRFLYQKTVDMLQAEEEERRMRNKIMGNNKTSQENDEKYKNSHLSNDDKESLMARIIDVMENDDEIFSSDFSLERLAVMCNSKYKYVSQVIHENTNQNFNNFLNSYRIKEACKRISDVEHYGQYTIEAISSSVGFKSRTTFVSSFKKITGLTPSQYQRLAQEDTSK